LTDTKKQEVELRDSENAPGVRRWVDVWWDTNGKEPDKDPPLLFYSGRLYAATESWGVNAEGMFAVRIYQLVPDVTVA
jgi:hypothetical protein